VTAINTKAQLTEWKYQVLSLGPRVLLVMPRCSIPLLSSSAICSSTLVMGDTLHGLSNINGTIYEYLQNETFYSRQKALFPVFLVDSWYDFMTDLFTYLDFSYAVW
jgi:hypothetical protein